MEMDGFGLIRHAYSDDARQNQKDEVSQKWASTILPHCFLSDVFRLILSSIHADTLNIA